MKAFLAPLAIFIAIAIPTLFGIIPAVIGVAALLLIVVIKDIIIMVFARGAPLEMIKMRMTGGILWGVVKHTGQLMIKRFQPSAGMVRTGHHGTFNIEPEGLLYVDGMPLGIAPEDVGYNIRVTDAQLVEEMKKRGISDIHEVCDMDPYGYVLNFKDDPRIKDLKIDVKPRQISLKNFAKYVTAAANPHGVDANIEIGIKQARKKDITKMAWLVGAGILIFLVCIGVFVLLSSGRVQEVKVIVENTVPQVIPV